MLKIDHLTKIYRIGTFGNKELRAVNDVSFEIDDGKVTSLIGESGSGKSTIGKMILRLISISSGRILYNDKDITPLHGGALKEYYRTVQGVFQDPFSSYNPIFKADRVFDKVRQEFFPEVRADEWRDRVEKAVSSVGLNPVHVLNKFPHQLSGGQLQRFLIARALLLDIKFLVADELISMLDASTRIDVLNLLAELKTTGLSILFITHDLSLANYISEKAIILYRGCIMEMGVTEKIFGNTMHPYTKMLVASVPRLDMKWGDVKIQLKAQQSAATSGCAYYGRCSLADASCATTRPSLVEAEKDHWVACSKL